MFGILSKIFYFQIILTSSDSDIIENPALKRFTDAFKDDSAYKWMKARGKPSLDGCVLFFNTRDKVRNVLNVINTEEYKTIKSFIMETKMNLKEVSNAYQGTFNIISSVQRILKLIEKFKEIDDEMIYKEYDILYKNIELTILEFGLKFSQNKTLHSFFDRSYEKYNESNAVFANNYETRSFMDSIDEILHFDILPIAVKTPANVLANFKNFRYSKRCYEEEINCFIKGKYKIVCPKDIFRQISKCSFDKTDRSAVDVNKYMDIPLSCNLTIVKILMILFHYYSEVLKKNTKYNIVYKSYRYYIITWSYSLNPRLEKIVRYWLRKKIQNLSERIMIPKFSFINGLKKEYSTVMSEDTLKDPITTRLILLSCGHQLGLELITDFFKSFYINNSSPITCNVCGMTIKILGSYYTNIYECKVENNEN